MGRWRGTRGGEAAALEEFFNFVCGRYPSNEGLRNGACHVSDYVMLGVSCRRTRLNKLTIL